MQKTITRILSLQTAVCLTIPICACSIATVFIASGMLLGSAAALCSTSMVGWFFICIFGSPFLVGAFTIAMLLSAVASKLFRYGTENIQQAELFANLVVFMTVVGFILKMLES